MSYITVTRGPICIPCSGLCIFSSQLPHHRLSGSFCISHPGLQDLLISFPECRHFFPLTSVALSVLLRVPMFLFNISLLWADTTKSHRAFLQTQYVKGLQLSCLCYTFTNLDQKSCMVWQFLNLELGRYGLWAKFQIFNSLNHWAIENIGGPLSKQSNSALLLVPSFLHKLQDLVSYVSIGI